jgi:hypothetical protein
MKDFVIEYHERNDPCRVFIWETQAETETEAYFKFHNERNNGGCCIIDIKEGKWDKDNFKLVTV